MSLPIEEDVQKLKAWLDEIHAYAKSSGKSFNYALEVVLGRHSLSKFSSAAKVIERRPKVIAALRYMNDHGKLPLKPVSDEAQQISPVRPVSRTPARGSWIQGYYGNT